MNSFPRSKTVFILSAGSDIGLELAKNYLKDGYQVVGTFRTSAHVQKLQGFARCQLLACDITKKQAIAGMVAQYKRLKQPWDIFISCVGDPRPLTPFFKGGFDDWSESVHINAIEQLRVLHALYPLRNSKKQCNVVFFAGGGTNNTVVNMSAYTASKIFLIKMCEFLDAENKDLNFFIVGPGWTRTKIHQTILNDRGISAKKRKETSDFLKHKKGTSLRDIYDCIRWLSSQGKAIVGGRNFSIVYDPWKGKKNKILVKALKSDPDMYKLKRSKNNFHINPG